MKTSRHHQGARQTGRQTSTSETVSSSFLPVPNLSQDLLGFFNCWSNKTPATVFVPIVKARASKFGQFMTDPLSLSPLEEALPGSQQKTITSWFVLVHWPSRLIREIDHKYEEQIKRRRKGGETATDQWIYWMVIAGAIVRKLNAFQWNSIRRCKRALNRWTVSLVPWLVLKKVKN